MRIGVDVRGLTVPLSGIGRYTKCILDELTNYPDVTWFLYADRPILHSIENPNVVVRQFEQHNRLFSLIRTQFSFSRWAREDKIDIFWSPRHHLPLLLGSRLKKVVTIHDMVWVKYPETMITTNRILESVLMPVSIKLADQVIAVSHATKKDVAEYFKGTCSKINVIHEAVENFDPAEDKPEVETYFLFVGTREPRKNLSSLIAAYKDYRAKGGSNNLIIVGARGWKQEDIAADSVSGLKIMGHVGDEKLASLYRFADALLLPSLYEGFGLTALEAMQYGVPVIGSDRSAIPEVVGQGGILVDPLSVDSLSKAMRDVSTDRELQATLSRHALEQASNFSWQKAAKETMAVFIRVVA